MIRHENTDAMILGSALMTGIHSPGRFEYFQGVNASHKRTG
jgi:hypothetical protein